MTTSDELLALIEESRKKVAAMSQQERDEMMRKQCEGWGRAEASWPKPKYIWINGTKVYESYEDYCLD